MFNKLEDTNPLEGFQKELEELKRKELSGESSSHHFIEAAGGPEIIPELLGVEEMKIYEALKEESLSNEGFQKYRESLDKRGFESNEERDSVFHFSAYIANMLMIQSMKRGVYNRKYI